MTKRYDKAYFDRWYRGRGRINTHAEVRRKVTLAVTMSEYFLRHPIRTVLDVGCGEGAWFPHLRALRPRVQYSGFDSSDYAVERYGAERNIRKATFGELPKLKLGVYDLVICSDMLHYVPEDEIRIGLKTVAEVTDGLAFLEVLTREDDVSGDLDAFFRRPAAWYRTQFRSAGLTFVGPYCWLSPAFKDAVAELESCPR
jgi:SAM-dependent methyltransferase